MSVLTDIVTERRRQVERDKRNGVRGPDHARDHGGDRAQRFLDRLAAAKDHGVADPHTRLPHAVIAEVKRRSPSRGELRPHLDPATLARSYEHAGAAAVSVLTEPARFGGSYEDLSAVSRAVGVAVLCKDFVIDPFQVLQARDAGADLILLMVSVLGGETGHYVRLVRAAGMEPLVEVHSEAELEIAVAAGSRLIGVNNRDLRTLNVDLDVCRRLLPTVPDHAFAVAESGLVTREDLDHLATFGAHAFLVGQALVTSADPGSTLREMTRADRTFTDPLDGERRSPEAAALGADR